MMARGLLIIFVLTVLASCQFGGSESTLGDIFGTDQNAEDVAVESTPTAVNFLVTNTSLGADLESVDTTTKITLYFSDSLDESSLTHSSLSLVGDSFQQIIPVTTTLTNSSKNLVIEPAIPLEKSTDYTLTLNAGVMSLAGAELASAFTVEFTTKSFGASSYHLSTLQNDQTIRGLCSDGLESFNATFNTTDSILENNCSEGYFELTPETLNAGANILTLTAIKGGKTSQAEYKINYCSELEAITPSTSFDGGMGTYDSPYQISSAEQLAGIGSSATFLSKSYILNNDIDLTCKDFSPIGSISGPFKGNLFGNNKVIRGMINSDVGGDYRGLFAYIYPSSGGYSGFIQNLGLIGSMVEGNTYVGALAGKIYGGVSLEGVYATGKVTGFGGSGHSKIGGLIGHCYSSSTFNRLISYVDVEGYQTVGGLVGHLQSSTMRFSYSLGNVTSSYLYTGGFAGYTSSATLQHIYSSSPVISDGRHIGGLIGIMAYGKIKNSISTGNVISNNLSSSTQGGGLVGRLYGASAVIQNSYSSGTVKGYKYLGGLVGYVRHSNTVIDSSSSSDVQGTQYVGGLFGGFYSDASEATVERLSFLGMASGDRDTHAIVGYNKSTPSIEDTFYLDDACDTDDNCTAVYGTSKSEAQLKLQETYTGWNFNGGGSWKFYDDGEFPHMSRLKCLFGSETVVPDTDYSGSGTSESPYLIDSVEKLAGISLNLTAHYKLTSDIDNSNRCIRWSGLGSESSPFSGTFDGGDFEISSLLLDEKGSDLGFFKVVHSATIKNLKLKNFIEQQHSGYYYVGSLAGRIYNTDVSNVHNSGPVSSKSSYTGGLVGRVLDYSEISNSSSNSDVSISSWGSQIAGLIGRLEYSEINDSYSAGTLTAKGSLAGGLVGFTVDAEIHNSYSTMDIDHNNDQRGYIGGLVGAIYHGTEVSNSYATGLVETNGSSSVGGLIGNHGYRNTARDSEINNCYATGSVNGSTNVGGLVGLIVSADDEINNSYSTGIVSGNPESNVGGLVGSNTEEASVDSSYYLDTSCLTENNCNPIAIEAPEDLGEAKSDSELKAESTFIDWDFSSDWLIEESVSYPTLKTD
ncbi:MAG: Ig-like domain-containing protein [Bacteriovoracaceae bacterium]|jgi:hypothetical protein|nr:Ig-like domain-containing protein [Bacteriovoracaceae bacterium]